MSYTAILAADKNIIPYRKELNAITGGVTSSILLQQISYWWIQSGRKAFYKFIEPCAHEKYSAGDSWTEELGFTRKEFITAIKRLEAAGFVSKKTNSSRTTTYTLHEDCLNDAMSSLYKSESKGFTKIPKGDLPKAQKGFTKSPKGDLPLLSETTSETTHKDLLSGKPDVASKVIQHLNDKTGSKFRATKTNVKFIDARLAEGATPADLIAVINRKCLEWLDNPQMRQYLRPSTLFNAEKFNTYIGQLDAPLPVKRQAQPDHMSRHTGFGEKDYKNGLIEQEDGSYAF